MGGVIESGDIPNPRNGRLYNIMFIIGYLGRSVALAYKDGDHLPPFKYSSAHDLDWDADSDMI